MSDQELENLVKIRKLKEEPCTRKEFDGYLKSGKNRRSDAHNEDLSEDSRFDLAYSAAHAFASAALRRKGYRSEDRYIVFQTLTHTAALSADRIQTFARAHNERNLMEYQGRTEIDLDLLADLIRATDELEGIVTALDPPG